MFVLINRAALVWEPQFDTHPPPKKEHIQTVRNEECPYLYDDCIS